MISVEIDDGHDNSKHTGWEPGAQYTRMKDEGWRMEDAAELWAGN